MKIGVCIPSRGTVYSQTVEEVLREVKGIDFEIFWSHANPIPDCFNLITEKALKDKEVTHLWFVEEDMGLPKGVLKKMLQADAPIVACDYPIPPKPSATVFYDPSKQAYFTGTGCLLVKREVFNKKPYWRADIEWGIRVEQDQLYLTPRRVNPERDIYGHHDITFGLLQYLSGNPIKVVKPYCWQRRMVKQGDEGVNQGSHTIHEYKGVYEKHFRVTDEYNHDLVKLKELDGEIIWANKSQAKKLITNGIATKFTPGEVIINDPDHVMEELCA